MPIAAAVIGVGGTLYASSQASKAANKQIAAQQTATQQQLALQRDAFNQQQQNLAPYLQAGYGALTQLQQQFGLGTSPEQSRAGQTDWSQYLAQNPDAAAWVQTKADTGRSAEDLAAEHYRLDGSRRELPVYAAPTQAANTNTPQTYGPQVGERPTYARPDQPSAPAMPDLSAAAYQQSPGFQTGLLAGQRNLNANFAARGLLGSGAGAEAAIKFGTDYQNQDYGNWRNNQLAQWQTQLAQFNQDRANTNANFNQDRQFGTGVYDADRNYGTNRFDTQVGNLFNLVGLGNPSQTNGLLQNYANNTGNLLQNGANNLSSIYGQQANNAGGLAGNLVGIGQGLLGNYGRAGSLASDLQFGAMLNPNLF